MERHLVKYELQDSETGLWRVEYWCGLECDDVHFMQDSMSADDAGPLCAECVEAKKAAEHTPGTS